MISPVKIWRNQKQTSRLLGKTGSIISFTMIRVPPIGFEDQAPYPIVLVRIDQKNHIGQLVDYDGQEIKIGLKVQAILRRVRQPDAEGVIPYGIKFKIIES